MADINIQRKKSAPNPWLLVLLAAVALAAGAYFFLRPDAPDEPAPPAPAAMLPPAPDTATSAAAPAPTDTNAPRTARRAHPETPAPDAPAETAASLAAQAATDPAAPDYARQGLARLQAVLVDLADRDDLRDPTITEQRDNLTSATARLAEAGASPRPGFVAAAGLIRAMQQKAYPQLEGAAADLVGQAGRLSGRSATAAEQQQNRQFLTQAAAAVGVLSEPAR